MCRLHAVLAAGLTVFALSATEASPGGEPFKVLHSFEGLPGGLYPYAGLTLGPDGDFYGTTAYGGASTNCNLNCGTVFRTKRNGTTAVLHSFSGLDGAQPVTSLTLGNDGRFYGSANVGGPSNGGTLFSMTPKGKLKLLHTFAPGNAGGSFPASALVQGPDGTFYGTTSGGGTGTAAACFANQRNGCGTVFKFTGKGGLQVLHSFTGEGGDGAFPVGNLMMASDGNLYGVTSNGGAQQGGALFRVAPDGGTTTLHSFDYSTGSFPLGGVVQADDGTLYGTSADGGGKRGGTIYRISLAGDYRVLYEFDLSEGGAAPHGTLVLDAQGQLYGATQWGGNQACFFGCGYVFRVSTSGEFTRLHEFSGGDGNWPGEGLLLDGKKLVGMTQYGGEQDAGVIYTLKAPGSSD